MILFASVTPLGVLAGALVGSFADNIACAVLTAIAAGTFIYVGLLEIAAKELRDRTAVIPKAVAMIVGYVIMALLAVWY
jgi:zinc transporter 1/2/3